MRAVPEEIPVTRPVDTTVAMAVLPLLHVPPVRVLVSVVVPPVASVAVPPMVGGLLLTVTTLVTRQPPAIVYDIVTTPPVIPVTIPVVLPTVPTVRPLLLQVPPVVVLLSVVVVPAHILAVPVMAAGALFTVTTRVLIQPVDNRYVIVVVPAVNPRTTPDVFTVPTAMLLLLQVPPPGHASVVVLATHTEAVPVIASGAAFTVTILILKHPPALL